MSEVRRTGDTDRGGEILRCKKSALYQVEGGNLAIFQPHTV